MSSQRFAAILLLTLSFAAGANAQTLTLGSGPYPTMVQDPGPVVTNSYRIGHPASPTVRGGHANFEHPAFAARVEHGVDANTFIVGHPAAPMSAPGAAVSAPVAVPVASLPIVIR
ncbi:MAG: hypothetical protein QFE16_01695 [Pseudomonadota bacterium]|nr:hypothetical protein [Pseudomonadota bacterium]